MQAVLRRAVDAAFLAGTPINSFASKAQRVAFRIERNQALPALLRSRAEKPNAKERT